MTASIQSRRGNSPPHSAVIPVAAVDPGSCRYRGGVGLDAADELLARPRVPQLNGCEPEPALDEVNVRVDETGNDEPSAEVEDLTAGCARADVGGGPDGHDAIAGDGDGLGFWLRGTAGPDAAVDERKRDHGTSRLR